MDTKHDHAILCGTDGTKVEVYETESEGARVKCPKCGRSDTLAFAEAEAGKADLAERIDRAIEDVAVEDMVRSPPTVEPRWVFGEP